MAKNLKKSVKSKKPDFAKAQNSDGASGKIFLTSEARFAFIWLRKEFTEATILHHFDPERNIRIETDL